MLKYLIAIICCMLINYVYSTEITIRSGDVLQIEIPGEVDFEKSFQVKRDGTINLPEVGTISIKNKTLAQVKQQLTERLGQQYRAIDNLSIFLIERRLPIHVLGFVNKPGLVNLPEDGNIQMALQNAGGPKAGAQLDKIQLNRQGKVITFDYKNYLDTGNFNILPNLQPLDVVFVPASPLIGNVQMDFDAATLSASGDGSESETAIKVFGEVLKPGVFSFKAGNTVVDMLMRAGGVTRYAGVEQIRVINNGAPQLFNLKKYLDTGDNLHMPKITPGSTLFVPIQQEEIKTGSRTIYVMGEVFKPGAYEAPKGTKFFDILANAGGPTRFAESRKIRIIRTSGKVDSFDLQAFTEGRKKADVPAVFPGDAVFVPEKTDMIEESWLKISPNNSIRIIGAVKKPGRYEWGDEMNFLDILAHAGGPTQDADMTKVRVLSKDGNKSTPPFNLEYFIKEGGSFSLLPHVAAGDTIIISDRGRNVTDNKNIWLQQPQESSIYIFGQVGQPGRYAFNNKLHILDILSAANGPNQNADIHNIKITHRNNFQSKVSHLDLGLYFETGDETLLPIVKAGDTIFVPERNKPWIDNKKEQTVRIIGAVEKPGRYQFSADMTILDLLAVSGGPTKTAYLEMIMVVNISQSQAEENISRVFDLEEFIEHPDFTKLPLVRVGDTIYIPDVSQSNWNVFMDNVKDVLSIVSLVAIVGGL